MSQRSEAWSAARVPPLRNGGQLPDPLSELALRAPSATAVVAGQERITWAELEARVGVMAGRMATLGVRPGSRVALLEPAGPEFVVALHACLRLGACVVPLPLRAPAADIGRYLADCQPSLVLVSAPSAETALAFGGRYELRSFDNSVAALDRVPGDAIPGTSLVGSRELCVIYTSGSSGKPKGVKLTVANHHASAAGCAESLGGLHHDDTWLVALGVHRIGGLAILVRSALAGFAVSLVPRFEEQSVAAALAAGTTIASFVPAMVDRLLAAGQRERLRGLRAIMLGGAPVPVGRTEAWARAGLRICPSYGLSETCSQIATVPPGAALEYLGTSGTVHSRAMVAFLDGGEISDASAGELCVGGEVLSPGYVVSELDASRFFDQAGARWFRTGDVGAVDDRGALAITGRVDYTINTGGEKVQPEEVEAALMDHPGVLDVFVCGAPDDRYGSIVVAYVVGDAAHAELTQWCRERLAHYKLPRRFVTVEAIPRSEEGKLLREAPVPASGAQRP
jgi:O-succinylbenzoic acid--CoA ligase